MKVADVLLVAQTAAVDTAAEAGEVITTPVIIANLFLLSLFVGCIVAWIRMIRTRLLRGRPMLDPIERRPAFWSPMNFVLLIGLVLVVSPLTATIGKLGGIKMEGTAELVMGTGSFLICCLIVIGYLAIMFPTRFTELGLRPHWPDVRLGVVSGLFVIPPLMVLMGFLSRLRPYEHDVLDAIADEGTPVNFAALFVATAILTPFVEEFSIRVLLQGSLQSVADQKLVYSAAIESQAADSLASAPNVSNSAETSVSNELATPDESGANNPYEPSSATPDGILAAHSIPDPSLQSIAPKAIWPMVVTSGIFAGLHIGQGLAPVALFFFSLALGYLYRQTGRITAPVVLHMVLNSMTMVATYFGVG